MVDKKLHIIGESDNVLGPKDMNAELKRSDLGNNKDLLKIFDYYNKNKDGKYTNVLDKTELYEAIQDREDASLNYDVGTAGLKGKLNTVLKEIKSKEYQKQGINVNSAEAIMELVAMNYNGNNVPKKDSKYGNALSQVKYVYARDVLMRF